MTIIIMTINNSTQRSNQHNIQNSQTPAFIPISNI